MAFPEMQSGEGDFVASIQQIAERNFFGALEMGLINDRAIREKVKQAAADLGFKVGLWSPAIDSQSKPKFQSS